MLSGLAFCCESSIISCICFKPEKKGWLILHISIALLPPLSLPLLPLSHFCFILFSILLCFIFQLVVCSCFLTSMLLILSLIQMRRGELNERLCWLGFTVASRNRAPFSANQLNNAVCHVFNLLENLEYEVEQG